MATEEKIVSCAAYYRKLLDKRPQPPESLSQAPDSRLHVIVERAGAKRRSDPLLTRLEQAFDAEGILTYPRLTDPGLALDDRVFMLDARHPIMGLTETRQLFRDEGALHDFIWANRYQFDEFAALGLTDFQQQVRLDSGRRVDLLCKRPAHNQLVGIELKVREPDDRAAGQLQEYLDDLADHARTHGFDSAHLVVVAGQPDKSVKDHVESYAASRGHTVTFLLYKVKLDLLPHP